MDSFGVVSSSDVSLAKLTSLRAVTKEHSDVTGEPGGVGRRGEASATCKASSYFCREVIAIVDCDLLVQVCRTSCLNLCFIPFAAPQISQFYPPKPQASGLRPQEAPSIPLLAHTTVLLFSLYNVERKSLCFVQIDKSRERCFCFSHCFATLFQRILYIASSPYPSVCHSLSGATRASTVSTLPW